jgi:hypothetical protein
MSALPPKADTAQYGGNVRFVLQVDILLFQRASAFSQKCWPITYLQLG